MKILISDPFGSELPGLLAKFGEVTDNHDELPDADIVLVRSKTKATKEYIDSAPKLKMIIRGGVGIDNIDTAYCKEKGIIVNNTPAASSVAVAELAMTLMLCTRRNVPKAHATTNAGEWKKKELKGKELYKNTLGFIGIGRIASEVAKRAKAFEMDIVAYDPFVESSPYATMVGSLDELYAKSDFISLHTPLTDDTREMINKGSIAKMKDGVIIINTSRGKCINEADLAEALKSGKVGYAGLDVFFTEPPEGSPLVGLDNVILSPHIGAQTHENMGRISEIVVELIDGFVKKQQ